MLQREIEFRAKKNIDNSWVYGLLTNDMKGHYRINFDVKYFSCVVKPDTIGQFTGLHDKNGKEIYEGDVVKAPLLDPIFGDVIKDTFCNAEIRFNKGSFVVSYYKREHNIYLSDLYKRIEVIGNIFDNKELLEE